MRPNSATETYLAMPPHRRKLRTQASGTLLVPEMTRLTARGIPGDPQLKIPRVDRTLSENDPILGRFVR